MESATIGLAAFFGALLLFFWVMQWHFDRELRFLRMASNQRLSMIDTMGRFEPENIWAYFKEFDEVDLEEHANALKRGDDPIKLYGPLIRRMMMRAA